MFVWGGGGGDRYDGLFKSVERTGSAWMLLSTIFSRLKCWLEFASSKIFLLLLCRYVLLASIIVI
jgi:hypothetical protein